jgi:hypothetical protein
VSFVGCSSSVTRDSSDACASFCFAAKRWQHHRLCGVLLLLLGRLTHQRSKPAISRLAGCRKSFTAKSLLMCCVMYAECIVVESKQTAYMLSDVQVE